MTRRLESNVFVDGQWYGPSYPDAGDPPSGVNEKAFGTSEDDESGASEGASSDAAASEGPRDRPRRTRT